MKKTILNQIASFSKLITFVWLGLWIETILFSQLLVALGLGDAAAIQYINDHVLQIGLIICGFYFSTKCIENVAKGVEAYLSSTKETTDKEQFPEQDTTDEEELGGDDDVL